MINRCVDCDEPSGAHERCGACRPPVVATGQKPRFTAWRSEEFEQAMRKPVAALGERVRRRREP
jgi:hypothetical protein